MGICSGSPQKQKNKQIRSISQPVEYIKSPPQKIAHPIQNIIIQQNQQLTHAEQCDELKSQSLTGCCYSHCHSDQDNFIRLPCKHYYHQECMNNITVCCLCQAEIPIKETNRIKLINFKEQLRDIYESCKNDMEFVKCQDDKCSFIFIFQMNSHSSGDYEYFCHQCGKTYQYKKEMIMKLQAYEKQQIEERKKNNCYGCEKSFEQSNPMILSCQHKWHENCLYDYLGDQYKFRCKCDVKIENSLISTQMKNKILESQIFQIWQQQQNHIQYCTLNQNCTFLYVDEENTGNEYCPLCSTQDQINQINSLKVQQRTSRINPLDCYQCKSQLFSFSIEINNCNHKYHLLCAQDLIKNGVINLIKCNCGQILDESTKEKMMIQCVKCDKYDDSLILMDCMHYIHYNCLDEYADEFSDMQCSECQFSIASCLADPRLQLIQEKLKRIKDEKQQQLWLDPKFCIGCCRHGENLIHLDCKHHYHEDCLQKMITHKSRCANPAVNCRCGFLIKNAYQYLSQQIVP